MREFVYFSKSAVTTGNFDDLMQAGRMDIAAHIIVHSFFISNDVRTNTKAHMFFYGPPDPPKHLEIVSNEKGIEASISKKDIIGLIKRMLYKYKKGKRHEAFPNCFVEKRSIIDFAKNMKKQNRNMYILDEKGEYIWDAELGEDPIIIMGDHEGLPKAQKRRLKTLAKPISLGKPTYFASQSLAITQYELDKRGIF